MLIFLICYVFYIIFEAENSFFHINLALSGIFPAGFFHTALSSNDLKNNFQSTGYFFEKTG